MKASQCNNVVRIGILIMCYNKELSIICISYLATGKPQLVLCDIARVYLGFYRSHLYVLKGGVFRALAHLNCCIDAIYL